MGSLDSAVQSQARNIERGTGRSIDEWVALINASGRDRHSDIVAWLKAEHGFSYGNANFVALAAKRGTSAGGDDLVDKLYTGAKASLRPLHDHVVTTVREFGDDIELAPKQAYVSLRRSKQFGSVGPGPRGSLEIGLNLAGTHPSDRLEATRGMYTHRVRLSSSDEFDAEVIAWLREAYDRA